jgi:archaellum component FlaF (FlaF/FlaG flagellin family)
MLVFFKIDSLGGGLGPKFILHDDFGLTDPYEFTKDELLNGVNLDVNPSATKITVISEGSLCIDSCHPISPKKEYLLPTTTTTSTTSTSTTSTSTSSSTTSTTTSQFFCCLYINNTQQPVTVNYKDCELQIVFNGYVVMPTEGIYVVPGTGSGPGFSLLTLDSCF